MCSIIGYLGPDRAAPLLVQGLKKMEYRGYDSAGIATLENSQIFVKKGVGKVNEVNLKQQLDSLPGSMGLGHTRWATHGGVTEKNAHPHLSSSSEFALVHNGIIDNYVELRTELTEQGYTFKSDTDSEVIVNLLQKNYEITLDLKLALIATVSELKGRYSFVVLAKDGTMAGAKFREPLVIGISPDSSYFVSSDILGFISKTDKVIYLDDSEFVILDQQKQKISIFDFEGKPVKHQVTKVSTEFTDSGKSDYVHYTLKEIYEQPTTILRSGSTSKLELDWVSDTIKRTKNVYITGSGTSFHAALIGKYLFSKYAKIKIEPIVSSETQFSPIYFDGNSVLIALSQSGESADVLDTVRLAKESEAEIISIVNVTTSSLAHMSSVSIGLNCGPEIGVAATKSFTSQLAIMYRLAERLSQPKIKVDFNLVSNAISKLVFNHSGIEQLSKEIRDIKDIYILGKGIHYYVALEASLKLKELPYIHAEALPGGELKHGPLALLDSDTFVIVINPEDSTYSSMSAAAHEVKARGAKIIGISNVPNEIYDRWIQIPTVDEMLYPMIEMVPIQLLSYYSAIVRNANPDYPRNLAKSVTVK